MTAALDSSLELSLGALVAERPERAQLFDRLHLDYCCLRVREPSAVGAGIESGEQLLPCCEGWIAEQTRRWSKHAERS